MAREIVVWCDLHMLRDERVPSSGYDVVVRRQGDAFEFVSVDLCEACAKPLADLVAELADAGRPFDDESATALGARPSRRKVAPTAPVDGRFPCPVVGCGASSISRNGLQKHVSAQHGTSLGAIERGEHVPPTHACATCEKLFTSRQGVVVHAVRSHGSAAAADEPQAQERAGG